ncbi:MAG: basic amino acid ABC transporter substrate-binding protein [Armatimonadota bacterium]
MKRNTWLAIVIIIAATVVALYVRAGGQRRTAAPPAAPTTAAPGAAAVPDLGGREIKIGSDTTYPPFEIVDAQKNIVGFDPDLMAEICRRANCKATFVSTAWDGIFVALAQGQFDAVVSGVTISDERRKTVDFSEPYLRYGQVVLVRTEETAITGVDTLRGKTVGVQTGTTNDEKATALQKEGKVGDVKRYETFALAVKALINKDLDAVIIDGPAGDGHMAVNPGTLKKVGEPFTSEALGIAIKQGETGLKTAFDAALAQMKSDGTIDRLYQKWFVENPPGK